MEEKVKYVLLEVGTMEELREYHTLESALEDLKWKDPYGFWIGIVEEKQAYTIPQFLDKFINKGDDNMLEVRIVKLYENNYAQIKQGHEKETLCCEDIFPCIGSSCERCILCNGEININELEIISCHISKDN